MSSKEVGYEVEDWIQLAQNRVRWRARTKTVMNNRVP